MSWLSRTAPAAIAIYLSAMGVGHTTTVNGAYSFTVLNGQSRGLAFEPNVPVILNDGSVVYAEGTGADFSAPQNSIVTLGADGTRREIMLPDVDGIRQVSANNVGQIVAAVSNVASGLNQLVLIEPDGHSQVLLEYTALSGAAVPTRNVQDFQINDAGTIAAFVSVEPGNPADPGVERVLRITPATSGAPTIDILDESRRVVGDPDFRDLPAGVTIDADGRIGWRVSLPSEQQILVDDGGGGDLVYNTSNAPVLNNDGEALVVGPFPGFGIGTTDVTDGVVDDFAEITPGGGCAPGDLNDYRQVVCLTNDGRLLLDGEVVARVGDVVDGLEIASFTLGGGPRLVSGEGLNDSGQIVIEATLIERDASGAVSSPSGFASGMALLQNSCREGFTSRIHAVRRVA